MEGLHHKRLINERTSGGGCQEQTEVENRDPSGRPQNSLRLMLLKRRRRRLDGKRFLLMDEAITRRKRILLFSSDQQLDMLFSSSIIYMDGAFFKIPTTFQITIYCTGYIA